MTDTTRTMLHGRPALPSIRRFNLLRWLLITLIGSLTAGALFAVGILLFGEFGDLEGKILGSTVLLGLFSLAGLAAALRIERRLAAWLGWLGMTASAAGYALTVVGMWAALGSDLFARFSGSIVLAAMAAAFVSLLLLIRPVRPLVRWVLRATLALAAALWGMFQYLMIAIPDEPGERFLRVLGALAVLVALGALVSPILNRMSGPAKPAVSEAGYPARAA